MSAEADAVNHPGIDGTSKACRYDDGPGWSGEKNAAFRLANYH